jgi:hypothetical protein
MRERKGLSYRAEFLDSFLSLTPSPRSLIREGRGFPVPRRVCLGATRKNKHKNR